MHLFFLGILAGGKEIPLEKVTQVAIKLGYLFQSQDDWLDVYGNSAMTGKVRLEGKID